MNFRDERKRISACIDHPAQCKFERKTEAPSTLLTRRRKDVGVVSGCVSISNHSKGGVQSLAV